MSNPILPPLPVECSYASLRQSYFKNCLKSFEIKYNRFTGQYVKRNNWDYWTEKEQNEIKYICNKCLIAFYQDKYFFWEQVPNLKKRHILGIYVNEGVLTKK